MKILFLTIGRMESINVYGIYTDLLRCLMNHGHDVYTVSAYEKRMNKETELIDDFGAKMLHVRIGNITKCGMIEKGISTLQIEKCFLHAIKKYFADVKFDLVLYSTPPITFAKVIQYVKRRDGARTYLLLKDIFPQNAVDLGLMSTKGLKGILYKYFRKKEKRLYEISDRIGCMSLANVNYILKHNCEINTDKVEVCPNCIDVQDMRLSGEERKLMRNRYEIPLDKRVFVYGGNLGKPQGVTFLIECLKSQEKNKKAFFLIVGDGTEYGKLEKYFEVSKPENMRLLRSLPKGEYDRMIAACDVGMIFLDYRFTIPNFPSRLLSYMQAGLPILACTDANTDVGKIIAENGFGWWCGSNSLKMFESKVNEILDSDIESMERKAYEYLLERYSISKAYEKIIKE